MNWFSKIHELAGQEYERYLPTAFDESLTLLEKVNKVIETLNQIVLGVNTVADYVDGHVNTQNEKIKQLRDDFEILKDWLENEGLEERTKQVLNEWFDNGRLAEIINNDVFNMKVDKVTFEQFVLSITTQLEQTEHELNVQLAQAGANVKSFGAKGDGLTDDTQPFLDALATGNSVFVPSGDFLVSKTLELNQRGQEIFGVGRLSKIIATDNTFDLIQTNESYIGLRDLYLAGSNKTVTKHNAGISIVNTIRSNFTNLTVENFSVGVKLASTGLAHLNSFLGCTLTHNALCGLYIRQGAHGLLFTGGEIQGNKFGVVMGELLEAGVLNFDFNLNPGSSVKIVNTTVEGNSDTDIFIGNGTLNPIIKGVYLESGHADTGKNSYIRVGNRLKNDGVTQATGAPIGVVISDCYFYTIPALAGAFPCVNIEAVNTITIDGNSSAALQTFIDTQNARTALNVNYGSNYVNNAINIGTPSTIQVTGNDYPVSKITGHSKIRKVWDKELSNYTDLIYYPNTTDGILAIAGMPLTLVKPPILPTNTVPLAKITATVGTISVTTNNFKVIKYASHIELFISGTVTLTSPSFILIDLSDSIPTGKKISGVLGGKLGDFYFEGQSNNSVTRDSDTRVKLLQGSGSLIPAGTYNLNGSLSLLLV